MAKVEFDYVGEEGYTIYMACFQVYMRARYIFKRQKADWTKVVEDTEKVFDYLVKQGEKYGFNVDSILEIPNSNGATCFSIASRCSEKISRCIIGRDIKENNITFDMMIPAFEHLALTMQMMGKGINPHIISNNGMSCVEMFSSSFESEWAKRLLSQFPRSVHFSVEDINCDEICPEDCPSKFEKFYYKNGELVKMNDENRIGQGGFGSVFKGLFHGKEKAMKCVLIGRIEARNNVKDAVSDFQNNISEIRIQIASAGSEVIVPEAFVRQQKQEQDENGKWIAKNYNIYIYPLYDCNLYELHENHFDNFTEEILGEIIHQCFNRKGILVFFLGHW